MDIQPLFKSWPLGDDADWTALVGTICGRKSSSSVSATIEYLRRLGAKLVVEESAYIDRDYRTTHAQFYSRQFRLLPQLCKRYHFFTDGGGTWSVRTTDKPPEQGSYLGYIIRRPLPWAPIGRSILSSVVQGECAIKNGSIPCAATFEPHIDGTRFAVRGVPFSQQDSVAMSCAETSIWVTARVMTKRFKHPLVVPPMVASPAAVGFASMGRTFPSRGLSLQHISHALNSLDLHPLYYNKDGYREDTAIRWNPVHLSYPYLASGIPCVLGVPGHAVTACGFVRQSTPIKRKPPTDETSPPSYVTSVADWISALICQDDQMGPYRIMPRGKNVYDVLKADPDYRHFLVENEKWSWRTTDEVGGVLAALPDKIYLTAENAELLVRTLLSPAMPATRRHLINPRRA